MPSQVNLRATFDTGPTVPRADAGKRAILGMGKAADTAAEQFKDATRAINGLGKATEASLKKFKKLLNPPGGGGGGRGPAKAAEDAREKLLRLTRQQEIAIGIAKKHGVSMTVARRAVMAFGKDTGRATKEAAQHAVALGKVEREAKTMAEAERTAARAVKALATAERVAAREAKNLAAQQAKAAAAGRGHVTVFGKQFNVLGGLAKVAKATALAVGLAIGGSAVVYANFSAEMSQVTGVMRANRAESILLTDQAKMLGETTEKTALQAARAQTALARAGFDAVETLATVPQVVDLSTAAVLDLAEAAGITGTTIRAFRLEAADSQGVVDDLTTAAANSNTTVGQLGEAFKFVGPVAGALKKGVAETAGALGVLADSGLQATIGGTGLRRVWSSLIAPTNVARGAIAGMHLTLEDLDPNVNSTIDIVKRLADANISAGEAFKIFGLRGGPAILALTANVPRLEELTAKLNDNEGATADLAAQMRDNLKGDADQLKSALEGVGIALGENLSPGLRQGTQDLTDFTRANGEAMAGIGSLAGDVIPVLLAILAPLGKALAGVSWTLGHMLGSNLAADFDDDIAKITSTANAFASALDAFDKAAGDVVSSGNLAAINKEIDVQSSALGKAVIRFQELKAVVDPAKMAYGQTAAAIALATDATMEGTKAQDHAKRRVGENTLAWLEAKKVLDDNLATYHEARIEVDRLTESVGVLAKGTEGLGDTHVATAAEIEAAAEEYAAFVDLQREGAALTARFTAPEILAAAEIERINGLLAQSVITADVAYAAIRQVLLAESDRLEETLKGAKAAADTAAASFEETLDRVSQDREIVVAVSFVAGSGGMVEGPRADDSFFGPMSSVASSESLGEAPIDQILPSEEGLAEWSKSYESTTEAAADATMGVKDAWGEVLDAASVVADTIGGEWGEMLNGLLEIVDTVAGAWGQIGSGAGGGGGGAGGGGQVAGGLNAVSGVSSSSAKGQGAGAVKNLGAVMAVYAAVFDAFQDMIDKKKASVLSTPMEAGISGGQFQGRAEGSANGLTDTDAIKGVKAMKGAIDEFRIAAGLLITDLPAIGIAVSADGEKFELTVGGAVQGVFSSFEDAFDRGLKTALAGADIVGMGENLTRALGRSLVAQNPEELLELIPVLRRLDDAAAGLSAGYSAAKLASDQFMTALDVQGEKLIAAGVSIEDVIALREEEIQAQKRQVEASGAALAGVSSNLGAFGEWADSVQAFGDSQENEVLRRDQLIARAKPEDEVVAGWVEAGGAAGDAGKAAHESAEGMDRAGREEAVRNRLLNEEHKQVKKGNEALDDFGKGLGGSNGMTETTEEGTEAVEDFSGALGGIVPAINGVTDAFVEMIRESVAAQAVGGFLGEILAFQEKYGKEVAGNSDLQAQIAELEFRAMQIRIQLLVRELELNSASLGITQAQIAQYQSWADQIAGFTFTGVVQQGGGGGGGRRAQRDAIRDLFADLALEAHETREGVRALRGALADFRDTMADARKIGKISADEMRDAWEDFITVSARAATDGLQGPLDVLRGVGAMQRELMDSAAAFDDARAQLLLLEQAAAAEGMATEELTDARRELWRAERLATDQIVAGGLADELAALGLSLDPDVVRQVREAEFELARIRAINAVLAAEEAGFAQRFGLDVAALLAQISGAEMPDVGDDPPGPGPGPDKMRFKTLDELFASLADGVEASIMQIADDTATLMENATALGATFTQLAFLQSREVDALLKLGTDAVGSLQAELDAASGMSTFETRMRDMDARFAEVADTLAKVIDAAREAGGDVSGLEADLRKMAIAARVADRGLATELIGSLGDLGIVLPVEVTNALAAAEFESARAKTLATIAALEERHAFAALGVSAADLIAQVINATPGGARPGLDGRTVSGSRRSSGGGGGGRGEDLTALRNNVLGVLDAWNNVALGDATQEARTLAGALAKTTAEAGRAGVSLDDVAGAFAVMRKNFVDERLRQFEELGLTETERTLAGIKSQFTDILSSFMTIGVEAQDFARAGEAFATAIGDLEDGLKMGIRGQLAELQATDPTKTNADRFVESRKAFRDLAAKAQGGDLEALAKLSDATSDFRAQIASFQGGRGNVGAEASIAEIQRLLTGIDETELISRDTAALEAAAASLSAIDATTKLQPTASGSSSGFSSVAAAVDGIDIDGITALISPADLETLVAGLGAAELSALVTQIGALPFSEMVDALGADLIVTLDQETLSGLGALATAGVTGADLEALVAGIGAAELGALATKIGSLPFSEMVDALGADILVQLSPEALNELSSGISLLASGDIDTLVAGLGASELAALVATIGALPFSALVETLGADLVVQFGADALSDFSSVIGAMDFSSIDISQDFGSIVAALGGIGTPMGELVTALGPAGFQAFISALAPIARATGSTATSAAAGAASGAAGAAAGSAGAAAGQTTAGALTIESGGRILDKLRFIRAATESTQAGLRGQHSVKLWLSDQLGAASALNRKFGVPGFKTGGVMPHDGPAMLHARERVLTASQTQRFDAIGGLGALELPPSTFQPIPVLNAPRPSGGDGVGTAELAAQVAKLTSIVSEMSRKMDAANGQKLRNGQATVQATAMVVDAVVGSGSTVVSALRSNRRPAGGVGSARR